MKTIKPNNMSLLFKVNYLNQQDVLTVAAFATFDFATSKSILVNEDVLWDVVDQNLAKNEILDEGYPKPRGEYLVYGSAYSVKPVTGLGAYVQVGALQKMVVVIGDRYWSTVGMEEPKPFTSIQINLANAFGGSEFLANPQGKGIAIDQTGKIPLPNIENPNDPITSSKSRPEIATFTGYPANNPLRIKHLGKIYSSYILDEWPGFPKTTNPEYFNIAAEDQRFKGYLTGTEKFTIKNMHPTKQTQSSQLPNVRLRLFIVQKDKQNITQFKELNNTPETLWLFPNQEIGTLLFRASIKVIDDEYSDITHLFATWESLNELPKSIESYYEQFSQEYPIITTNNEIEKNLDKQSVDIQSNPTSTPPEFKNELTADEITMAKVPNQENFIADDAKIELDHSRINNLINNYKLNKTIYQLDLSNLELNGLDLQEVSFNECNLSNTVFINCNLSHANFSNTIMHKITINNSIMLKTQISECYVGMSNFENSELDGIRIENSDFSESNLTNSSLVNSNMSLVNFDKCNFTAVNYADSSLQECLLVEAICHKTNFSNSLLINCNFSSANLEEANFSNIKTKQLNLSGSVGKKIIFSQSDLSYSRADKNTQLISSNWCNAVLTGSTWENAQLDGGDFTSSILNQVNFTGVSLKQAKLELAIAKEANFSKTDLTNANMNRINLFIGSLRKANLINTDIRYSNLYGVDFFKAKTGNTNLTGANLNRTLLVLDGNQPDII